MAEQLPIDDALLGKFLAGETDPAESARVRQWLASQPGSPGGPSPDDFAKFERIWEATSRLSRSPDTPLAQPGQAGFDTDAAWRAVQQKMHLGNERTDAGSMPVVRPLRQPERKPDWTPALYRVAAVLVLATSFGWMVYRLLFMSQDHPEAYRVTLVTADQKLSKTLPDGTKILLNRHSTLSYPAAFADDRREVTLTGEAFFEVTPDTTRPFRIQARPTVVQVLGTSFTVRAYDDNVQVAVQSGKVRFAGGKKTILLTKNQEATFDPQVDTIRRFPQLSANAFAFRTGQLVFVDEPLREVVKAINEYYNTDVRLANDRLSNCRLKTRFDQLPLDTVLNITAETLGLRIRHEGKQVILDGAGCP
ncbi:FecR family protein [Spirosoma koreense]